MGTFDERFWSKFHQTRLEGSDRAVHELVRKLAFSERLGKEYGPYSF